MNQLIKKMTLLSFLIIDLVLSTTTLANTEPLNSSNIWSLKPQGVNLRWVIIREKESNIYHIEVITRKDKAPIWQIKRLTPHLAITENALLASITTPLSSGDVYPESFYFAYKHWKQSREKIVCSTNVDDCLTSPK